MFHQLCPSSKVVQYSTLIPKIEASNSATGIGKEKMVTNVFHSLCPSSTEIYYLTLIPKVEASNSATAIGKDKIAKIYSSLAVSQ
jgi:hypothetical protein